VDAVRNQVIRKPLGEAMQNILALCKTAQTLPGMKRVDQLDEKQKYWFTLAVDELKKAQSYAGGEISKLEYIPALQRLIKAYLGFRNAVPLSQIKGGLADANSEAQHRAKLRYLESGFKEWTGVGQAPDPNDKTIYFQSFWELYDYDAMRKAVFHEVAPADAPGISSKESGLQIAADSVKQHLLTMKDAYPQSFKLFNTVESIYYVLGKMNLHEWNYAEILKLING